MSQRSDQDNLADRIVKYMKLKKCVEISRDQALEITREIPDFITVLARLADSPTEFKKELEDGNK